MLRGVLVSDVKLLTDHYLRQQHGRDIAVEGHGARMRGVMILEAFSKVLL